MMRTIFYCIVMMLTLSCVQTVNKSAIETSANDSSKTTQSSPAASITKIKRLFLALADQTANSQNQDVKGLGKLARAVGNASDDHVAKFLGSDYIDVVGPTVAVAPSTPPILAQYDTHAAAIAMIVLGTLTLTSQIVDASVRRTIPDPFYGMQQVTGAGLSIAALVVGAHLLNDNQLESLMAAQNFVLSAGIIHIISGLAQIGYGAYKVHGLTADAHEQMSRVNQHFPVAMEDRTLGAMESRVPLAIKVEPKDSEAVIAEKGRMIWGGFVVAMGVAFVAVSQTVGVPADLAGDPNASILKEINAEILKYRSHR